MDNLILGVCQLKQSYDIAANLKKAERMLNEAADMGARMVALPEMFLAPYEPEAIADARKHVRPALERVSEIAGRREIYIVAGSVPFDAGSSLPFNRSVVFGPDGREICHHDKVHLFDCSPPAGPAVKESAMLAAGDRLEVFDTPWGKAAVIVCYDIRFVQLTQFLADRDVKVLIVPAAFSLATGKAHWEMLIRMRALELQGFVAGIQPAYNDELNYIPWGHSIVADPWGEVQADCGQSECVRTVELDFARIMEIRERFPLLRHRRLDLYETVWKKK